MEKKKKAWRRVRESNRESWGKKSAFEVKENSPYKKSNQR